MHDADDFFAEQDKRMSIPDEDVDQFIQTRLAAPQKSNRPEGRCFSSSKDISGSPRSDGLHAPHLTGFRFPGDQAGVSSEVSPHSPRNPQVQRQLSFRLRTARESNSVETGDAGKEPNPVSLGSLSGPSSTMSVVLHGAKRRKTTAEYYIPERIARFPHTGSSECSVPDPSTSTSRMRESTNGVAVEAVLQHAFVNPARTRRSQRAHSDTHGRKSVFSSTDLASGNVRDPKTPFKQAQMTQINDPATLVTKEVPATSDAPPDSMLKNTSVIESFSPPAISSRCRPAITNTTSDGHGRNNFGLLKNPLHLLPADGIQKDVLATGVHPNIVPLLSSRSSEDSHEADCIGENPAPRMPAGINTAAYILDCSNLTSPGDLSSTRSHHASKGSHVPSTGASPSSSRILLPEELKTHKGVNGGRRSGRALSNKNSSKQVKDKPKLVTPLEYAHKLQSHFDMRVKPKRNHLRGKYIFYIGGDMVYAGSLTRGRMKYIVEHGGTLVPKYDPATVTHIVTNAGARHTLQALSLKSLSEIPDHIPTVTWDWVVSGHGRARKRKYPEADHKGKGRANDDSGNESDPLDFEFMHAAFPERIDAGCDWKNTRGGKRRGKPAHGPVPGVDHAYNHSSDVSHITTFSQENKPAPNKKRGVVLAVLPPAPLDFKSVNVHKVDRHAPSEKGRGAADVEDPLSEYYAQARADREAQWSRDVSDSDDGDDDYDHHRGPAPRRGFACDLKDHKPTVCVNQHIVDKLEELRELHQAKPSEDDRWRAYSYGKCIPAIRNYPKPIRSFSEARSIRGVGEKTALKIMEIINTGNLKRIKYENTEEVAATRIFQGIYGVGRHIAFAWFASGLRTLDDIRTRKGGLKLSKAQEIGLEFYDDINSRMPREEARRIFEMIKPVALAIDSELSIEVMGSYRRGKADCGDIDILITRPTADGKTHQGVLRTLLEQLHVADILTEDLALPDDFSDLELIYRGLCKLPEPGAKRRRIDFLCVPWMSRGAASLYYTGDDIFNRAMRLKANKHGFSLNQRGLFADVLRDPHNKHKKVYGGRMVASETEEEIFNILGVPWQEPHERVRA